MKWDLAVFDLDGTLIDTIQDLGAAVGAAMAANSLPSHTLAEYRRMVGHGVKNLVRTAMPEALRTDEDLFGKCLASFFDYYTSHIAVHSRPYPGIHGLLLDLRSAGTRIAVASNKFQAGTQTLISTFFPDVEFAAVLGGRDDLPLKPDAAVIDLAREMAGAGPGSRVVMVGDSATDIRTAANAGVDSIAVSWGFRPREELIGACAIADDAAQLAALLL